MTVTSRTPAGGGAARVLRVALTFLALVLLAATPAGAQDDAGAEVRLVIERLFEGMRSGDSTMVRSVFHPDARLLTTAVRDGDPVVQVGSIDEFVRAVGTPHDEVWDERISNLEIRVDDPLATAWMDYRFHLGDTFSHCGVNAFQLFRSEQGWRVLQITDTRHRECPG